MICFAVNRWSLALGLTLVLSGRAEAQSSSTIGQFLAPWGGSISFSHPDMTPDGEWIVFAERYIGPACWGAAQERISMIRTDGTGHRVVIPENVVGSFYPTPLDSQISDLVISGDGKRAWFRWPHKFDSICTDLPPPHSYLVDLEAGTMEEFLFNGKFVGLTSFTDDGSTMVFRGWDASANTYNIFRANADGSEPELLIDTSPWYGAGGKLSGDGSTYVFATWGGVSPFVSQLFVFDIRTQALTELKAEVVSIIALDISHDGERIVYAGVPQGVAATPVYGIAKDGSDSHLISPLSTGSGNSATISGNGEYVFYVNELVSGATDSDLRRCNWDGSEIHRIEGIELGQDTLFMNLGVSHDGSRFVYMENDPQSVLPLEVWFADPPMLTTYGRLTAGTTLTLDVGGQPGDAFVLRLGSASSPYLGWSKAAQGIGPSGFDDLLAGLLVPGVVGGPQNIGTVQMVLPPEIEQYQPREVSFQAIVFPADRGAPQLTNTTRVTLGGAPPPSLATADKQPPASRLRSVRQSLPTATPAHLASPEERLRQLALLDPGIWWKLEQQGVTKALGWEDDE